MVHCRSIPIYLTLNPKYICRKPPTFLRAARFGTACLVAGEQPFVGDCSQAAVAARRTNAFAEVVAGEQPFAGEVVESVRI